MACGQNLAKVPSVYFLTNSDALAAPGQQFLLQGKKRQAVQRDHVAGLDIFQTTPCFVGLSLSHIVSLWDVSPGDG